MMKSTSFHCLCLLLFTNISAIRAFVHHNGPKLSRSRPSILNSKRSLDKDNDSTNASTSKTDSSNLPRRSMIKKGAQMMAAPFLMNTMILNNNDKSNIANAAVGTLPEFADTNAVLQGITVDVADLTQQKAMINFLVDGFQFKILRQRKILSITETWLGFGPEEMKIPDDFEMAVSSFSGYGGHSSICIRYDANAMSTYYKPGSDVTGDNVAYVQVGVPEYRISQMVKNGGDIIDAFGIVNVVSPSGLPMRGIVGISPDPIMFVALNCQNLKQSVEFYEQLGFVKQEYPFCRPNKGMGQFEPPQPKNSVYLAPSKNSMGVLLLQSKKRNVKSNPAFRGMKIVYSPSEGTTVDPNDVLQVKDPSGTNISFQPFESFAKEEASSKFIAKEEQQGS